MKLAYNRFINFGHSLILLVICIFVIDLSLGNLLRYYYFKQTSGLLYRTTYSIDSTKADIIVFGSSKANHNYVPELFEDSLKMSFYNTGRDGNYLLFSYAIFTSIVKRYNPKLVIFDIGPDELSQENDSYDRLSALLPYYRQHPELRNIVTLKSPFERIKLLSSIYPFNSSLLTIAMGNLEYNKKRKRDIKGYVPLYGNMEDTLKYSHESNGILLDYNKTKVVDDINNFCREKEIKVVFILSPMYSRTTKTMTLEFFDRLLESSWAKFWNFSDSTEFIITPKLFQDSDHLNDTGARIFSNLVVQKIKNEVEIKK